MLLEYCVRLGQHEGCGIMVPVYCVKLGQHEGCGTMVPAYCVGHGQYEGCGTMVQVYCIGPLRYDEHDGCGISTCVQPRFNMLDVGEISMLLVILAVWSCNCSGFPVLEFPSSGFKP